MTADDEQVEQKPELGGAVGRAASFACRLGVHDVCPEGDTECRCRCHE